MGWKHIAAAFKYTENDLSETAQHILLRIAWEMRDNDYAFPGTAYIAERIHVSRKTVQRAINELSASGAITVGKDETDKPFKAVKFAADLMPGKWYRISYFVRGERVAPHARRGGANAVVWQSEAADRGKVYPTVGLDGTFDWVHQSGEFRIPKRLPEGFKPEVDVRLIHATGTAHFDGLIVEEIRK